MEHYHLQVEWLFYLIWPAYFHGIYIDPSKLQLASEELGGDVQSCLQGRWGEGGEGPLWLVAAGCWCLVVADFWCSKMQNNYGGRLKWSNTSTHHSVGAIEYGQYGGEGWILVAFVLAFLGTIIAPFHFIEATMLHDLGLVECHLWDLIFQLWIAYERIIAVLFPVVPSLLGMLLPTRILHFGGYLSPCNCRHFQRLGRMLS